MHFWHFSTVQLSQSVLLIFSAPTWNLQFAHTHLRTPLSPLPCWDITSRLRHIWNNPFGWYSLRHWTQIVGTKVRLDRRKDITLKKVYKLVLKNKQTHGCLMIQKFTAKSEHAIFEIKIDSRVLVRKVHGQIQSCIIRHQNGLTRLRTKILLRSEPNLLDSRSK